MSDEPPANRRRVTNRWRIRAVAGAGALLLVGAGLTLGAGHAVGLGSGSNRQASTTSADHGSGGKSPGAASTAAAAPTGGGNGSARDSGSGGASPPAGATPNGTPATLAPAPKTAINGKGQWDQSSCAGGFSPGDVCAVEFQGAYYLEGSPSQNLGTVIVQATTPDGKVLDTRSYPAPGGGHRYGAPLKFTIPPNAHEVDMSAKLVDASGKTLATTVVQRTFAT